MNDDTLNTTAIGQGGVITRTQALASGFSESQIDYRVTRGRWLRLSKGVYRLLPMERRIDRLAAAVAVLPNACASHFSAGALHELPLFSSDTVSVTVHASTTHTFHGVQVFRTRDLGTADVVELHHLPTTTLDRTVVDLASQLSRTHLERIIDDLVSAQRTSWKDVREAMERIARRGKPGITKLRTILEDRLGDDHPRSKLEQIGHEILLAGGFDCFELEFPMPWDQNRRFDVAFPAPKIAVEWDSRRWHTTASAFETDRRRDREAVMHGWRILRFTWDDLQSKPGMVSSTIRAVVSA